MIQRKTQNLAFWRNDFQITDADHEFLYETLVDSPTPLRVQALTQRLIEQRCQIEESRLRNELARGAIYDPKNSYQVGDAVVFPTFDFELATITAVRAGENPEHEPFSVISARFEGQKKERQFAAALSTPHALNRGDGESIVFDATDSLSPQELFSEIGDVVQARLEAHLRGHSDYFVSAGPMWFTTDQMAPVNLGHLNIAEAAIEMRGAPLRTTELFAPTELDSDISEVVRIFSLETALYNDDRFVQVGPRGQHAWYLRRLMPATAFEVPASLRVAPIRYDRSALDVELLQTEWELNDEFTDGGLAEEAPPQVSSTSVLLIYPHLTAGVLPLPPSARAIFPGGSGVCTAVTLVDGRWGTRFPGWVMHEGRYVAGLGDWFKQHKLPVGARIILSRGDAAGEVVVDFKPQRSKREWIRMMQFDGGIRFQIQRQQYNCEYDDHVTLLVLDEGAAEAYRARIAAQNLPLEVLVKQIMPELTRLSPQGTAHVKSLYSAVNVLRRTPPAPIFAALAQLPGVVDTGSGFWSF